MKKLLLVTSALACASFVTTAANAQGQQLAIVDDQDGASPVVQQQPAFAVRIAGGIRFDMIWTTQDTAIKAVDMQHSYQQGTNKADISLLGSATANNGLSYGFEYRFHKNNAQLHLSNRLGRLDMGNTNTAIDALDITGGSVMKGRGHFAGGGDGKAGALVAGFRKLTHASDGNGTIRYSTPNYGGLTIAFSYTENADGTEMTDGDSFEDIWSFGAQYTSSYGNYTTVVSVGWEQANQGLKNFQGGATSQDGNHDSTSLAIGAKVTGMGAGFAFGYGEHWVDTLAPTVPDKDSKWWDVGLSFASGPWGISIGAAHVTFDDATISGHTNLDQEMTAYSVSGDYALAPGLSLMAGLTNWDVENSDNGGTNRNNDGTVFVLATQMAF
jgi:predicted porin